VAASINEKLLSFVLGTNKQRGDFENIFHELKKQFKGGDHPIAGSTGGGPSAKSAHPSVSVRTKEIIITWFTDLFKAFQEELIDKQTDVFEQLINSLDFSE